MRRPGGSPSQLWPWVILMCCSFIERLKTLHWESITTTEEMQNEEEIRSQIKEEYDRRLKEEIKNIGHLYNSYEGEMRLTIQAIFDNKACSQQYIFHYLINKYFDCQWVKYPLICIIYDIYK